MPKEGAMDSNAVASAEPSASPAVRELLQRAADAQDTLRSMPYVSITFVAAPHVPPS